MTDVCQYGCVSKILRSCGEWGGAAGEANALNVQGALGVGSKGVYFSEEDESNRLEKHSANDDE